MNKLTPTIKNLLIINVLMFALNYIIPFLFPHSSFSLDDKLALYYFGSSRFEPYQIFTHFFMHANEMHLAFNMLSLYSIGSLLERFWGPKRVLNFYLLCGIGAAVFHMTIQAGIVYSQLGHFIPTEDELFRVGHIVNSAAVGASGAVFGIFAAVAILFPNSEFFIFFLPFPIKAKYLLIGVVIISILLGTVNFNSDPIAHFAHLGGIITGYALTKYFNKDKQRFY